ncbi:MAG TPA: stage V sporulation protein K [Massilibacterium sp.]|nr:stage V sporulation protein K [Massilibacterium sp.]
MIPPITLKENGQINVILNGERALSVVRCEQMKKEEEQVEHAPLHWMKQELDSLVGLDSLKTTIEEIYAWVYINEKRKEKGLKTDKQVLHMLFKGNPGTGKTTVARLIGQMFQKMNVLSKGHLIEVERADLVGEYIGHTAQKTRDLIKKALGGILFIDEAYALARGGEKDFGKEAIDTLVKSLEDKKHDFILILAGYKEEMDYFLSLNPGLPSRFPIKVDFPDYTVDELLEISRRLVKQKDYRFHPDAEWKLKEHLIEQKNRQESRFSNGRYIRNLLERAIRKQAMRLLHEGKGTKADLLLIRREDFIFEKETYS